MRKNKQLELLSTTHSGSQIVPRLEPKQIIKTNNKERDLKLITNKPRGRH